MQQHINSIPNVTSIEIAPISMNDPTDIDYDKYPHERSLIIQYGHNSIINLSLTAKTEEALKILTTTKL